MLWREQLPTKPEEFLNITDSEVMVLLREAANDSSKLGHDPARRIMKRKHYKRLYERNPNDIEKNPEAALAILEAAREKFGEEYIKYDSYRQKSSGTEFPVRSRDERVFSSVAQSDVLKKVPVVAIDYVFVAPEICKEAINWLEENRETIISQYEPEEE